MSMQGIYHMQGEDESRLGQREKLACNAISPDFPVNPTWSSELGVFLQSCPKMRCECTGPLYSYVGQLLDG